MADHLHRRHLLRGGLRPVSGPVLACLLLACLLLCLGFITVGCGGESQTEASTTAGEITSTTTVEDVGWSELADTVLTTWSEAIQELNGLLAGQPDPATIQSDVETLKEKYVQLFIEQGRIMAAMSDSDKTSAQDKISAQLGGFVDEDWYTTYLDSYNAYLDTDVDAEFMTLLASFNIITQYADFELLKAQEPEEAERLGLE